MEERIIYSEIPNIDSYCCVLGLNFPDSITEFQKAFLTLAHLFAASRDYVLKGVDVPFYIIHLADQLMTICLHEVDKQN
jgi:hypothetical protein